MMRTCTWKRSGVALLGVVLLGTTSSSHAADFAFEKQEDRIVVRAGNEWVTEYRFKERRPCLSPVMGPTGRHMARRWPLVADPAHPESEDHPHHSGLWFAHGDVRWEGSPAKADFWHKDRVEHLGFVDYDRHAAENALVADNQWIRKDGQVIATDRTRIQFGQSEDGRWIDYSIHISAPEDHALILGDTKEGTMALRVVEELAMETHDKKLRHLSTGKITNSEGLTGKAAWGKRAKWCAYHGEVEGKPALIAIFDHPENPRHPTWWMARHYGLFGANAFGKSFFEKAPRGSGDFRIPAGETVTFRYRFLFQSTAFEASAVEAQYTRFAEQDVSNSGAIDPQPGWTSIANGQEAADPVFSQARKSAEIAGLTLSKVQRWLHEKCLPCIDPKTKLYISSSRGSTRYKKALWNYDDAAADTYPFLFWAAWYTDYHKINGPILEVLEAEQRLCNHLDRIPTAVNHKTLEKVIKSKDNLIFAASEYVKDGLIAIVEVAGKDNPWFERMRAIEDDIWKHADIDTPYGKIPTKNIEANGEQIQALARLYTMTGEKKYLEWAHRLADYYLKPGKFVPDTLTDHGCEIIGGLGLLLAVDSTAAPEKFKEYEPHFRYMCDEILRRGTNSDGIIVAKLQSTPGPHDNVQLRDGWGYNYVAFLDYDMATGQSTYRKQIEFALGNLLKPRYENFNWDQRSRDGLADSVEGGLYLLNRLPVKAGLQWVDREIAQTLVDESDPNRLWETHKLEANAVRTALQHALMHTQGLIARPWKQNLELGAAETEKGLAIVLKSDQAYEGKLVFDRPRHRTEMGFKQDWPRMNTMPEWYTVEADQSYVVKNITQGSERTYSGKELQKGLPITFEAETEQQFLIMPSRI